MTKTPTVLVIDDEPDLLALVELTLTKLGLGVVAVLTVAEARQLITTQHFDLCLTDMRLKDGTGLDVLDAIAQAGIDLPTAVITAHGNAENAVSALKRGAFDYLAKPVSIEQLRTLVKSALAIPKKPATVSVAPPPGVGQAMTAVSGGRTLLGDSVSMVKLRELLARLALNNAPVHIHGESGTGKETAARILHEAGPRASGPFVAVNCGAIPESLMEAEFFGAKRGAYTGANEDRIGFFQAAHGGTLFLDEVADLPLSMQVKLLRAIQERAVRRVGATNEEAVDVRIVSATHKKLSDLVASGAFRQDLYYRLSVIPVHMPALREIRSDIGLIAQALLQKMSAAGSKPFVLTAAACRALEKYDFPGNVRELENLLERAIALSAKPGTIDEGDLFLAPTDVTDPDEPAPDELSAASSVPAERGQAAPPYVTGRGNLPLQDYLDQVEREALAEALAMAKGNRTKAARALGITFRSMRYRLERLGLDKGDT